VAVSAAVMPVVGIAITLLFLDLRARGRSRSPAGAKLDWVKSPPT
jgi:hypothetical protein